MSGYAYLDTSAFVKLCWPEPESAALRAYLLNWPIQVSSSLLWTEALRVAQRQSMARIARVRTALLQVAMIDVDRALFRQAGMLTPPGIRSLDAIHLASAASLGSDLGVFLSYDQRLVAAAVGHGLAVNSPT